MTPRQIVSCIDFRYITDALTPDEALELLERQDADEGRARGGAAARRLSRLHDVRRLDGLFRRRRSGACCREALADGFTHFKVKVGGAPDGRRAARALVREEIGPDRKLMIDANQRWDVGRSDRARARARALRPAGGSRSRRARTTCSDMRRSRAAVRAGSASRPASTAQNRVIFKQLLQASAIDFCQIDSCRLGGVNENLAVMLMAAKFGVPVCPHAGGVGLCELVQHLSMFDYIAVSGRMDDRVTEFVDHLHEHFVDPVVIRRGRYMAPTAPGYSS